MTVYVVLYEHMDDSAVIEGVFRTLEGAKAANPGRRWVPAETGNDAAGVVASDLSYGQSLSIMPFTVGQ